MMVARTGATRLPKSPRRPAAGPVTVSYFRPDGVLPEAWAEALQRAGGQRDRLRAEGPRTVLVLNFPGQFSRKGGRSR